jgi:hypothetical protein
LPDVLNEPEPDVNAMRLGAEIQRRPQAFSNFMQDPIKSCAAFAAPRKERDCIPIVQESIEFPTNRFPLPWALRLMRLHIALKSRLLRAHQSTVKGIAWRMPDDFPRIAKIVSFQCGSNLAKKFKTLRWSNGRPGLEKHREYGIDVRRRRKKKSVIA